MVLSTFSRVNFIWSTTPRVDSMAVGASVGLSTRQVDYWLRRRRMQGENTTISPPVIVHQ